MKTKSTSQDGTCQTLDSFPRSHIWLFNSGDQFAGNVKYLFLYVVTRRKDIYACYISESKKTADLICALGYRACTFQSQLAQTLMPKAGYYVVEQVKENYPESLKNVILVNLFHGVGLKSIERCWLRDFLGVPIARKYIRFNTFFRTKMCFLVTSPFMEKHFAEQLDLADNQILRAGYPRCGRIEESVRTYDPRIPLDGVPKNARLALYVPTYREVNSRNFLYRAITDVQALLDTLEKNGIVLIIKLHPKITDDFYFERLSSIARNNPYLILWDNQYDVYEIFDRIDIGIVDYSSMYYDLLAAGVRTFIRYIFDYKDENQFLIYDYFSNTTGSLCETFDDLLSALGRTGTSGEAEDKEKTKEILAKFWSYSGANDCEAILEQAFAFRVQSLPSLPTLYSFDIFDTLIARRVLKPVGIFYSVQETIRAHAERFPAIFSVKYPEIRMHAEANVREYTKKAIGLFEIQYDAIFQRLADVYGLTSESTQCLKQWETEAELANVIPVPANVSFCEELVKAHEKVVLISDMYLPKDVIQSMLSRVSTTIAGLPIYLSSAVGVQKTTQNLYLAVYRDLAPYRFGEWHHYGDNAFADVTVAKTLGIIPHHVPTAQYNEFEAAFVEGAQSADAFKVAALLARTRVRERLSTKEYYAFAHLGFTFVPYISWVVRDAVQKKISTLYFISRDGFFLKKLADTYIEAHNLSGSVQTKYIYGSRRVWRLPAMIDSVDDEFFSNFGNFVGVDSYTKLLSSLDISHGTFQKLFPELELCKKGAITKNDLEALASYFKSSPVFQKYLLEKAAEKREIVLEYLRQEIDCDESFAFVEFWGRGYTQALFGRLLDCAAGRPLDNIYYYFRSILPSEGRTIRRNFTTNTTSLIFVEAVFANFPYQTVRAYKKEYGRVVPVMDREPFDAALYYAIDTRTMECMRAFSELSVEGDRAALERLCADHALLWFEKHPDDPVLVDSLAHLRDSVELWGDVREFAPAFTMAHIRQLEAGRAISQLTRSLAMSLARAEPEVREAYASIGQNRPREKAEDRPVRTRKDRLLVKLSRDPMRFFSDSKNPLLRLAGAVCLSGPCKRTLGAALIAITRRRLSQ
ncbi:MAG: CDP-glycerol glycerophosphotransferase family protein [Desulfovibrionaceae bacterium]|nr:CDP-glycerol glycerophosphotransferase family protein [Desulfovibrionaceae bacterium]